MAKRKQKVAVGDLFAIPAGGAHYYGRVVHLFPPCAFVALYAARHDSPDVDAAIQSGLGPVKHHKWVLQPPAFDAYRWTVVGRVPVPDDYKMPYVLYGAHPYIDIKDVRKPRKRYRLPDADILARKIEPHVCFLPDVIERNLAVGRDDPWPEILATWRERGLPC